MKPVYLDMTAFGPYAGRQVIDFRLLGDRQLFLIYGPTGSGKTTILDAMCYALYGELTGGTEGRNGAHMRSEYATAEETTRVAFTFRVGQKLYRVERSPEQEIAKKRGTGTRHVSMKAALYEQDESGNETLVTSKNVSQEIEQILGFKSDQFRQVVLLPQGDFRKLLLANSSDRQRIMQVLFHTQRYDRLQVLARTMHDDVSRAYEDLKKKIEQYLSLAGAADEETLTRTIADKTARTETAKEQAGQAVRQRDAFQEEVQQAEAVASHWKAWDDARTRLQKLEEQKDTMAEMRKRLDLLEKARLLSEPCRTLDDIQKQGMDASKEWDNLQKKALAADEELKRLNGQETDMKAGHDACERDKAGVIRLESLVGEASSYAALKTERDKASQTAAACEKAWHRADQNREAAQNELEMIRKNRDALSGREGEYEKTKARTKQWKLRAAQEKQIEALQQTWQDTAGKQKEAAARLQKAVKKAMQDKTDFEAVNAMFLQGQAFVLAEHLHDGDACPVCGAVSHPKLAVKPADFPEKADVERCHKRAEASEKQRQQAEQDAQVLNAQAREQQRQYEALRQQYPADGTSADWSRRADQSAAEEAVLLKEIEQVRKLTQQLEEKEKTVTLRSAEGEQARKAYEEARLHLTRAEEGLSRAEQTLPEEYRNPAALKKKIQSLKQRLAEFEQKEKDWNAARQQKEQEKAHWSGQAKIKAEQRDALRLKYKSALEELKSQAGQYGFRDMNECRALQKEVQQIESLKDTLTSYEASRQQTQGQVLQEEKAIKDKARPDMEQYRKKLDALNQACQDLSRQQAALAAELGQLMNCASQIRAWHEEQAELSERYKTVGALYDLISGKTTGINFERYVLGALLDEVLQAANQRLQKMSRNRYELQRSHSWDDRRVRQIGLDIEVFDAYTGYARPANTLSGGETFLASLSLALGLADVVQAYSGGIHLDTIFIDEGFGTLDPETLDFALKALLELRQGGRLVGIISHVGELRERIDTRLAVRKTDCGSVASFELL